MVCTEYHVPEHLQPHIDFITLTVHFDTKILPRNPRKENEKRTSKSTSGLGSSLSGSLPNLSFFGGSDIRNQLENCSNNVTPLCLRALYEIPFALPVTNPKNSHGIVEYTPQSHIGTDLYLVFGNYCKSLVPVITNIWRS